MSAGTRRRLLLLGVLVALGAALVFWLRPASNAAPSARSTANPQGVRPGPSVGDVQLELLEGRNTERFRLDRNLFQFEARREPESAPRGGDRVAVATPTGPTTPGVAPPPPPIPLRYIGYLDQPGAVPRVAVLSDGRGNVFNGKEGDIIEGRYRVLRIGTDSADLIYVDGRGRQTIRLSGQ